MTPAGTSKGWQLSLGQLILVVVLAAMVPALVASFFAR